MQVKLIERNTINGAFFLLLKQFIEQSLGPHSEVRADSIIKLLSMKFFNFLFSALLAMSFLACGGDTAEQNQPQEAAPAIEGIQETTAPATTTTTTTTGDVKLNPPHGQPGHRCDIAVGAPLDGSAAAAPAETTTQSPLIQTQQPAAAAPATPVQATPTQTAAGMNPPHGQPGHRCDIAVGAPLDSKPKQ